MVSPVLPVHDLERQFALVPPDSLAAIWILVDEKRRAGFLEICGDMDGRRRLGHSALIIGDGYKRMYVCLVMPMSVRSAGGVSVRLFVRMTIRLYGLKRKGAGMGQRHLRPLRVHYGPSIILKTAVGDPLPPFRHQRFRNVGWSE